MFVGQLYREGMVDIMAHRQGLSFGLEGTEDGPWYFRGFVETCRAESDSSHVLLHNQFPEHVLEAQPPPPPPATFNYLVN